MKKVEKRAEGKGTVPRGDGAGENWKRVAEGGLSSGGSGPS